MKLTPLAWFLILTWPGPGAGTGTSSYIRTSGPHTLCTLARGRRAAGEMPLNRAGGSSHERDGKVDSYRVLRARSVNPTAKKYIPKIRNQTVTHGPGARRRTSAMPARSDQPSNAAIWSVRSRLTRTG